MLRPAFGFIDGKGHEWGTKSSHGGITCVGRAEREAEEIPSS